MIRLALIVALLVGSASAVYGGSEVPENLVPDPSFELPRPGGPDQFGHVFEKWSGWKYEGECAFRIGTVARTGRNSMLIVGGSQAKIRAWPANMVLEPGRYRIRAYIRGLDIGTGIYHQTTEFMFNGKYMKLEKNGTFGWTPLAYVADITEKKKMPHPSFGLMATGYLWVDDVSVEKVGTDVALTPSPVLGAEEEPIVPPGEITAGFVRCGECGYRNMPAWGKRCYACGAELAVKQKFSGPEVKILADFEKRSPFSNIRLVARHATRGKRAGMLRKSYASMDGKMDLRGYDYLKADVYTDAREPLKVYFEARDTGTKGYWTRVNYTTVVPPGSSTLIIPTALYVGEKSRPGRPLDLANVTRIVYSIGGEPEAPLYLDNVRLERDTEAEKMLFDGLWAFDCGKGASPVMEGFRQLTVSNSYSKGRGYGWKDARFWRDYDVLQPEPLYQDFVCIEKGGLAIDVPNGKYHVWMNTDSPSGYWGEYQRYKTRAVIIEGEEHRDNVTFDDFRKKYFRFWNSEDLPSENTFDKFQREYFKEKSFDVEVTDGQLNIDFDGQNWANCLSAVVVYPLDKKAEGEWFLKFVDRRRRFHFENYFKRVLHRPTGEVPAANRLGYVVFARDYMQDVYGNDRPGKGEVVGKLSAFASAGELEPVTFSIYPRKDLGRVEVSVSELKKGEDVISAGAVDVGYILNRVSRVTMEGSVYTIRPRHLMPGNSADVPKGLTRRFWLTVKVPEEAVSGIYRGKVTIMPEYGSAVSLPVELRVFAGTLDEVDVPVGPWGHAIGLPWYNEGVVTRWKAEMARKSLTKMREYGLTTCSGVPTIHLKGWANGKPRIDFTKADAQMGRLKECGFEKAVCNYGAGFSGLNLYYKDSAALKRSGFHDYSEMVGALFTEIQKHADGAGWLPVYWNLADEPIGEKLKQSIENAEAYKQAFPNGPPFFTAASSYSGKDPSDPHFRLAKALQVINWNGHSKESVELLHEHGSDWAFYNGGNRWTYGIYMYKAARQFGMKFRLSWHWNLVAGDPYYALDCREDDYAWCNASPGGTLIPSLQFEREIREGVDDYRYMSTLARLAKEKKGSAVAAEAEQLIADRMAAFKLGQRDHDKIFPTEDWREFRLKMAELIARLR
ncbi:MAG: glycoside hydrolase domain-containing protein [Pirellulales bacterium]